MIRYHILRKVTMAVRSAEVALLRLKTRAEKSAEVLAHHTKQHGLAMVGRKEDHSFDQLVDVQIESDRLIEDLGSQRFLIEQIDEERHRQVSVQCLKIRQQLEMEVL